MIQYTKNFNIKNSPGIELTEKYGLKKYTSSQKNNLSNLRKKFLEEVGIKLVKANKRTWKIKNIKSKSRSKSPSRHSIKSDKKKIGPKREKNETIKLSIKPRLRKQASGTRKLH
jgi:hypothetical protein